MTNVSTTRDLFDQPKIVEFRTDFDNNDENGRIYVRIFIGVKIGEDVTRRFSFLVYNGYTVHQQDHSGREKVELSKEQEELLCELASHCGIHSKPETFPWPEYGSLVKLIVSLVPETKQQGLFVQGRFFSSDTIVKEYLI